MTMERAVRLDALDRLTDALTEAREAMQDFQRKQDASSDEGNEGHLTALTRALDDADGAAGDLVP